MQLNVASPIKVRLLAFVNLEKDAVIRPCDKVNEKVKVFTFLGGGEGEVT